MKHFKGILVTGALMVGLAGGLLAQDQTWRGDRDNNNRDVYSQRQDRDREVAWNNGYRDNGQYRGRDYRSFGRDHDGDAYRMRNRDHSDQDHHRRDRDDRGRDGR